MSPETYKLIHVVGTLLLFLGLGGVLASAGKPGGSPSPLFLAMHGLGLVAVLVAGIGFAHKSHLGWPAWMIAKIAAWVILAVLPTLVRRGIVSRVVGVLFVVALGAGAAWIGLTNPKPF